MHLFVFAVGIFALVVGLIGLISPRTLGAFVQSWTGPTRFWFAVVIRLCVGAALIAAAPACRFPLFVRVIGVITILAALIILAAGQKRLDETIDWWIGSSARVRSSALFAIAMGALFVYVAGLSLV